MGTNFPEWVSSAVREVHGGISNLGLGYEVFGSHNVVAAIRVQRTFLNCNSKWADFERANKEYEEIREHECIYLVYINIRFIHFGCRKVDYIYFLNTPRFAPELRSPHKTIGTWDPC